ncbi:hypothetical protein GGR06_004061 [Bacteroides reticulotermitis]|uniref:O-antigen ligase-related domain-containing protein n=3 Tax=Bacteroides reticulotermitis TaxID=1133319 RepID=W4UZJ7_9BACE|nr:O-antigen ligase family protein [Bacteroides reticulotermitis]MBB4046228.1 hypothetical protein [Bacteroides reticulotermitis]GAE86262.1 hypothetical protein JCM10512_4759 [Bacteroides reticulotermitis JCM 10512]
MLVLSFIFALFFIAIIIFSFTKPKIAAALFTAYFLLVPIIKLQLGNISIGEKFLYLILILCFLIKYRNKFKYVNYTPFKPFIFLFIMNFILIFIQDFMIFRASMERFFTTILSSLLYPMVLYSILIIEKDAIKILLGVLVSCFIIIVGYGLFLTTMPGVNPYLMLSLPSFGMEFNEAYALGYSALDTTTHMGTIDGRLFGRISSVFMHTMQYGLVLGLFFVLFIYLFRKSKIKLFISISLIVLAVLTSGSRTPIGALLVTVGVVVLLLNKIRYLVMFLLFITLAIVILPLISEEVSEYVFSIVNSNDNVKGSSLEMRIEQLNACFDIIKYCFWEGKGYAWSYEYMSRFVVHPKLLCFESLLFVVLCNTGVLGVIVWGIFGILYLKSITNVRDKAKQMLLLSLFIFYIAFSCITGEYNYMKYFMLFYVFALGVSYSQSEDYRV